MLAARSPYFRKKLRAAPETRSWRLPASIPPPAFAIAIRYLYLSELPQDVGGGPGTGFTEEQVLEGVDRISAHLEIRSLWDGILEIHDRRLARQYQADEAERGRRQIEAWFWEHVLQYAIRVEAAKADDVRWDSANGIYADVLLRADDDELLPDESCEASGTQTPQANGGGTIPVGPLLSAAVARADARPPRMATLFPAHKAMLLRSEFFAAMFSSGFAEAQEAPHLRIISVDCSPEVLELVLTFLYTDRADLPLNRALDVLFAADMLLIERLKNKATVIISTLGHGSAQSREPTNGTTDDDGAEAAESDDDPLDPFAVLRAAWLLRVPRLEEFAARYFAQRLEHYIDRPEFLEIVAESAARIKARQATDSIELVDDIRHYLSERFRMRFEDAGLEELIAGEEATEAWLGGGAAEAAPRAEKEDDVVGVPVQDGDAAVAAAAAAAGGNVRTLDGELAEDEFESDALNYRSLLAKIDALLEKLDLDG